MMMKVNTIPDIEYSVTAPEGERCVVSASIGGVVYTLAVAEDGAQMRFQAVSREVEVSSPRALVRPLAGALPVGVTEAGARFVAQGVVDAALSGAAFALPQDASLPLSDGEWRALELPASVLPGGSLGAVEVPCMVGASPQALWLAAYAFDEASNGLVLLAVSDAAVMWGDGEAVVWSFADGLVVPQNRALRLFLLASRADAHAADVSLFNGHVRSFIANEGVCRVRYDALWYGDRTPQLVLHGRGHVGDGSHLLPMQRVGLMELLEHKDELLALVTV